MKKTICASLAALCLAGLSACGRGGDMEADLVFVNDSDTVIVEVVVDFQDQGGGTRNADSSPLRRGNSFGFEAGEYPVTVWVYDAPFEGFKQKELARLTISKAPPAGKRWYVTARDGTDGLRFDVDTQWPKEV